MIAISNYLFMISLGLLILSFVLSGVGRRGMTNHDNVGDPSGSITDLQMEHDHKKVVEAQNSLMSKVIRSYLFWISLMGIIVSMLISKI